MIINIPAIQAWWDATLIKIFRQIPYPNEIRMRAEEEEVLVSEPERSISGGEGGLRQRTRDRRAEGGETNEVVRRRRPGWRFWEYFW